jgi:rhodanese-related sulfurtransferase
MRTRRFAGTTILLMPGLLLLCGAGPLAPVSKAKPSIYEATLEAQQQAQSTPELSTQELRAFVAAGAGVVLDARPKLDFDAAHIPGSVSIEATGLLRVAQSLPATSTPVVIYSDGPYSDAARRRGNELLRMGYANVSRYQLGLAVWRALGNTAESSLDGVRRIFQGNNAVFVDARSRAEYSAGTVPAAESVLAGEVTSATKDHRLQYYDHATRIVVFGSSAAQARTVAEEIARNAYPNSSYFSGSYQELKRASFFAERKPSPFNLDGLAR